MSKRNAFIATGIGVWASGMLVGANAIGFLPGEPSWHPGVLLAIGVIASIGNLAALLRAGSVIGRGCEQ